MLRLLLALALAGAAGCTTTLSVEPAVETRIASTRLAFPTRYLGDPRYLPSSLVAASASDAPFAYRYELSYRHEDAPFVLQMLYPLVLLGMPVSESTVTAVAQLEVWEADSVVKRYDATAVATQKRSVYSSDSLSLLRAQVLAAVRDSIDAQVIADEVYLTDLERAAATRTQASP